MNKQTAAGLALTLAALCAPAWAQNIAVVNGKTVPKSRLDTLIQRVSAEAGAGRALPPNLEALARDQVVMDEIFAQEAQRRGLSRDPAYLAEMDALRQNLLVDFLFQDFQRKNAVTDADLAKAYEQIKSENAGTEYHARHILVDDEALAKQLITQLKGGASFAELAKKHSKDPGSGQQGGDLGFSAPNAYVPEFGQALTALKKGETTAAPVKSQFGWHIIRLEDTRTAQFPPLEAVTDQLRQHVTQQRLGEFRKSLIQKARTDYKFSQTPQ